MLPKKHALRTYLSTFKPKVLTNELQIRFQDFAARRFT